MFFCQINIADWMLPDHCTQLQCYFLHNNKTSKTSHSKVNRYKIWSISPSGYLLVCVPVLLICLGSQICSWSHWLSPRKKKNLAFDHKWYTHHCSKVWSQEDFFVINTCIEQRHIQLAKNYNKYILNVTKDLYFK